MGRTVRDGKTFSGISGLISSSLARSGLWQGNIEQFEDTVCHGTLDRADGLGFLAIDRVNICPGRKALVDPHQCNNNTVRCENVGIRRYLQRLRY